MKFYEAILGLPRNKLNYSVLKAKDYIFVDMSRWQLPLIYHLMIVVTTNFGVSLSLPYPSSRCPQSHASCWFLDAK